MQRNEILNLNLVESTPLGNGYCLFAHELFDVLFIERDGDYQVREEDQSKLDKIIEFENKPRVKILNYNPDSKKHLPANIK